MNMAMIGRNGGDTRKKRGGCLITNFFLLLPFVAASSSSSAAQDTTTTSATTDSTVTYDWIDPDTPSKYHSIKPLAKGDHRSYELVFSDEFNVEGRTFQDGADPRWTALNKNDITNSPFHYYSHDPDTAYVGKNGSLSIQLNLEQRDGLWAPGGSLDPQSSKELKSGMIQSWNKFCFTGGIVEFEVKLPSAANRGAGLWPAIWMMGNLGRATYVHSTEQIWPFSTNDCNDRTKNSQLINSCSDNAAEVVDGMPKGRGRGAPEIDLLEIMMMEQYFTNPILSSSLHVAPGVPKASRPELGHPPNASQTWYSPEFGEDVSQNYYYGTESYPYDHEGADPYMTDSLSVQMELQNDDYFHNYHKYRIEWEPPHDELGSGGYLQWFIDDQLVTAVYGDDLKAISQTEIPSEPMYLVMNIAVSKGWGFPDADYMNHHCPNMTQPPCYSCYNPECSCALPKGFCSSLPTSMEIDSVRVYQPKQSRTGFLNFLNQNHNNHHAQYSATCSPPNRPTAKYIEANKDIYKLDDDEEPLRPIQIGGGNCTNDSDCGGGGGGDSTRTKRGFCTTSSGTSNGSSKNNLTTASTSVCVCNPNWVGPHCLAHLGVQNTTTTSGEEEDNKWQSYQNWFYSFQRWILFGFLLLVSVCVTSFLRTFCLGQQYPQQQSSSLWENKNYERVSSEVLLSPINSNNNLQESTSSPQKIPSVESSSDQDSATLLVEESEASKLSTSSRRSWVPITPQATTPSLPPSYKSYQNNF